MISGFSLIHSTDLRVWTLLPRYGLHPLGAEERGVGGSLGLEGPLGVLYGPAR